jgi:two-component system, LytTR family, response regulator
MRVLIIEDEAHAAQRLGKLIVLREPTAEILGPIDSVKAAVCWFNSQTHPDLVFMDVQLADGVCFMIFEQCKIKAPIIFTTAYDQYALKAFKVNSIDYILKPVDKEDLFRAIDKFKDLSRNQVLPGEVLTNIEEAMKMLTQKYKSRFVVKIGEHLRTVETGDILFFLSQDKATFCVTSDLRYILIDFTLEQLEDMIDPERFYRINRKYIVSTEAIRDIVSYANSRLKLKLKGAKESDVVVARERVQDFKAWLDR